MAISEDHGKGAVGGANPACEMASASDRRPEGDDRRAISLAYGVCDALHVAREATVFRAGDDDHDSTGEAPNRHVYATTKSGRFLVV
jgi:hypothetical protein